MKSPIRWILFAVTTLISLQISAQFQNTYEHLMSDDHSALVKSISGGGYVQASTSFGITKDIHLMKFDANGNMLLDVVFNTGSTDEHALDIARGNNDTYVVCGYEHVGGLDLGFVMSVDTSFNILGKVNIQVPANDKHTPCLNIINSAFYDKPTFGTYWNADPNGGYLITGFEATGYNATDSKSAYVIKVDNSLTVQWARKFNSPISAGTPDWDMASHGNWIWVGLLGYMIGGSGTSPAGEQCSMATVLDLAGNVIWSKLYSDNNAPGTFCVAADGAYDDAEAEVYQLSNFSQTQGGGIIAFNQFNGMINMARSRYLTAASPDYYNYEFAATCAGSEVLISGYGLNQTAGAIQGTFPYTIRYNKNNPMVDTWWQHYAYPVQSATYTPAASIFDTYSTSEQPRIYYPKLFASRLVNQITLAGFQDNTTFHENHLIHPYFDGKDSCNFIDPQIVAIPLPIYEWPVNNSPATYVLPSSGITSSPLSPTVTICSNCTVDASFTVATGPGCTYTFTANSPSNFCSLFTIKDISNNIIFSSASNSINFTFSLNGTYTICYEDCGPDTNGLICREETCQTIQVNCPPSCNVDADFSYNINGCCVTFTDLTPDGDPDGCEKWVFGNISSMQSVDNASFCFPGSGTYTVCHIDCCRPAGSSTPIYHQVCKQITVNCVPPCCLPDNFSVAQNGCCITLTPTFPSSSCSALYYFWNFGDGNTSTSANPTHCYASSGVYKVCMTAYCGKKKKIQICRRVFVKCAIISPGGGTGVGTSFGWNHSGTLVQFNPLNPVGSSLQITSRSWNFGDGTTSSETNPTHQYALAGTYEVTYSIEGTDTETGEAFSASHTESMTLVLNPACGCRPPETDAFAGTPEVCGSNTPISLHLIDFDGEADVTHQWMRSSCCCDDCDDTNDFTEIPGAVGQYVWLSGTDVSGSYRCRSRSNVTGIVTWSNVVYVEHGVSPSVSLTASPSTVCQGQSTLLQASSADAAEYEWFPSSGSTSSSVHVSPPVTSEYSVVAATASGCGSYATTTVQVNACSPPGNNEPQGAVPCIVYIPSVCASTNGDLTAATPSVQSTSSVVTGEDVWFRFIAPEPGVRIILNTSSFDGLIELHRAPGDIVETENARSGVGGEILNYYDPGAPLTTGQTYYVVVRNVDSSLGTGTFSICVQRLADSGCNSGPGPYTSCNLFKVKSTMANSYQVTFTNTSTGETVVLTNNGGITNFPLGSLLPGYSYLVDVSCTYNLSDAAGTPEIITIHRSAACTITTLPHADVDLRSIDQCPPTGNVRLRNSVVGAHTWICGAYNYEWEFTPTGGSGLLFQAFGPPTNRFIALGNVPQLTGGSQYEVRIRPTFNGGLFSGDWGSDTQCLTIAGAAGIIADESSATDPGTRELTHVENSIVLYPNPNLGERFVLEGNYEQDEQVQMKITDASGRLVHVKKLILYAGRPLVVEFANPLAKGVYYVDLIFTHQMTTQKLVVE